MATLFDVLYRTLSILRRERAGTATSGSATTLVDTAKTGQNDFLDGGTIFVFTGNNANKSAIITSWTVGTNTFLFPTMTTVCAAGDLYSAFDNRYPKVAAIQAVNSALTSMGPYQATNEALTTTDNTESYSLPAGVVDVRRVQVATSTNSPYEWSEPLHNWYEKTGKIYFKDYWNIPTGKLLRLSYGTPATRISLDAATLPAGLEPERLAAEAAWWLAWQRTGFGGQSDTDAQNDLQMTTLYRNEMRGRYPVRMEPRDSKYTVLP